MILEALALLEQPQPDAKDLPARIESLAVCAFDVGAHITELSDLAASHEEIATSEASAESNEAKRKSRRCELLRADGEYLGIRQDIAAAERVRFLLNERAHRFSRELRLIVAEMSRQC